MQHFKSLIEKEMLLRLFDPTIILAFAAAADISASVRDNNSGIESFKEIRFALKKILLFP